MTREFKMIVRSRSTSLKLLAWCQRNRALLQVDKRRDVDVDLTWRCAWPNFPSRFVRNLESFVSQDFMEFDGSFGGLCSWRSSILVTSRVKRHENIIFASPAASWEAFLTMKFRFLVRCSTMGAGAPTFRFLDVTDLVDLGHFPHFFRAGKFIPLPFGGSTNWEWGWLLSGYLWRSCGGGFFLVLVSSLASPKTQTGICVDLCWKIWLIH